MRASGGAAWSSRRACGPRGDGAVARTLHAIVARFDGHPCIGGVWVREAEEGAGDVELWVRLRAEADAAVYGLRAGDAIEAPPEGSVRDGGARGRPEAAVPAGAHAEARRRRR